MKYLIILFTLITFNISAQTDSAGVFLEHIDSIRTSIDIQPLMLDSRLNESAKLKLDHMVTHQYFGHVDTVNNISFRFFIIDQGYYGISSENILRGYVNPIRAAKLFDGSPAHHNNIVNPCFTHTGIAIRKVVFRNKVTIFYVQHFGGPIRLNYDCK